MVLLKIGKRIVVERYDVNVYRDELSYVQAKSSERCNSMCSGIFLAVKKLQSTDKVGGAPTTV